MHVHLEVVLLYSEREHRILTCICLRATLFSLAIILFFSLCVGLMSYLCCACYTWILVRVVQELPVDRTLAYTEALVEHFEASSGAEAGGVPILLLIRFSFEIVAQFLILQLESTVLVLTTHVQQRLVEAPVAQFGD